MSAFETIVEEIETKTIYRVLGKRFYSRYEAEQALEQYMALPTLEEWAQQNIPEALPLYTSGELCKRLDWGDPSAPVCCGKKVNTWGVFGGASRAWCEVCGKAASDVTGPGLTSNGAAVVFMDSNLFRYAQDDEEPPAWTIHQAEPTAAEACSEVDR